MAVNRPPFDFGVPFRARCRFLYAGKWYREGELFPWRDLGLDEGAVFALWRGAQIDNETPDQAAAAAVGRGGLLALALVGSAVAAPPPPRPPAPVVVEAAAARKAKPRPAAGA